MDITHYTHTCTHAYTYIKQESMRGRKTSKGGRGQKKVKGFDLKAEREGAGDQKTEEMGLGWG